MGPTTTQERREVSNHDKRGQGRTSRQAHLAQASQWLCPAGLAATVATALAGLAATTALAAADSDDNITPASTSFAASNSGTWKLVFVDAPNDESQAEPNSGDSLSLSIPAGGAKVTSSLLSSCPVTNSAATVTAAYDDTNTATFTNQKIPGSACGISATANFSGTYVTSVNISDAS